MKRTWLKPNWVANKCIHDIDITNLRKHKIEALLLDVDGTLLPRKEKRLHKDVKEWLIKAKKIFVIHLLSNNPSKKRIKLIADELDVSYTYRASKPFKASTLNAIKKFNINSSKIALLGDRIFTDILIGNRLGIYTILVKPIGSDGSVCNNDNWQMIERNFAKLLGVK
tara:strand:- start:1867 stop:2370 length:504 start_codon:yes stop_codon:yes gene_type:complete